MAYVKRNLVDGETLIDKSLLGHMQDGIYNAHEQLSIAIFAVLTAAKMDEIIAEANATGANVGSFYMYLGETTASYKKGSVYQIEEE